MTPKTDEELRRELFHAAFAWCEVLTARLDADNEGMGLPDSVAASMAEDRLRDAVEAIQEHAGLPVGEARPLALLDRLAEERLRDRVDALAPE